MVFAAHWGVTPGKAASVPRTIPLHGMRCARCLNGVRPVGRPGVKHGGGIGRSSEASVVATQRAKEIAVFEIEVMAQDHAAIPKIRAQVKKVVLSVAADQLHPERHHLHVASCTDTRQCVLAKAALD